MKVFNKNSFISIISKNLKLLVTSSPRIMIFFILWSIIYAGIDPLILYIDKMFIELLNIHLENNTMYQQVLTFLFVSLAIKIYRGFHDCMMGYIAENSILEAIRQFRMTVYKKCNRLSLDNFEVNGLYNTIEKAIRGSEQISSSSGLIIYLLSFHLISVISITVYLFTLNKILAFVVVFIFIPKFISLKIKGKYQYKLRDSLTADLRRADYLKKCIVDRNFFKETRILNAKLFFRKQWIEKMIEIIGAEWKVDLKIFMIDLFLSFFTFIGYVATFALAAFLLFYDKIQVASFAVTLIAATRLFTILDSFTNLFSQSYHNIINGKFVYDFLEMKEDLGGNKIATLNNDITLKDVSYIYYGSKTKALNNINVCIKKGETVAIVGHNGSGKSTLTKILLGLYRVTSGQVLYDSIDINDINTYSIYEQSSAVLQNYGRYNLTFRENIALSDISNLENDDKIKGILKNLNYNINNDKYINGLDSNIGREFGGIELSGGEWQLLSIARALFKKSCFVVLDEPTSAIDPIRESEIYNLFIQLTKDKTAVIVTHRLGSAVLADRILVMEKGAIVEVGTHKELIEINGTYARMYREQSRWYER